MFLSRAGQGVLRPRVPLPGRLPRHERCSPSRAAKPNRGRTAPPSRAQGRTTEKEETRTRPRQYRVGSTGATGDINAWRDEPTVAFGRRRRGPRPRRCRCGRRSRRRCSTGCSSPGPAATRGRSGDEPRAMVDIWGTGEPSPPLSFGNLILVGRTPQTPTRDRGRSIEERRDGRREARRRSCEMNRGRDRYPSNRSAAGNATGHRRRRSSSSRGISRLVDLPVGDEDRSARSEGSSGVVPVSDILFGTFQEGVVQGSSGVSAGPYRRGSIGNSRP